jgi:hypothetical protein
VTEDTLESLARDILLRMVEGRTIGVEAAETTAKCAVALAEAFSAELDAREKREM